MSNGIETTMGTMHNYTPDAARSGQRQDRGPEYRPTTGRYVVQRIVFSFLRGAAGVCGLALLVITGFIVYYGLPAITWEFLTQSPRESLTAGGILPCIVGTIVLAYGSLLLALPWGVATAVYLNEYATPGRLVRCIRLGINNLAGVPSVVFGLFGLSFFVIFLKFGVSILAGVCTLAAYILPLVIGASEEALRAVPQTYREASLALGGTKFQTIYKVVLPSALPGILTGAILGLGRAAGETAAIMFTAAVFSTPTMPSTVFSEVMALPFHIFVLATAGTNIEKTRPLQYGTALVLIVLVLGMNMAAILLRARLQKKY